LTRNLGNLEGRTRKNALINSAYFPKVPRFPRLFYNESALICVYFLIKGGEVLRIGNGYDVHCLQAGRKLILGGVEIDYPRGLEGHSDADVLLHAICDALLGAAGLGDIGRHFPDSDQRYHGISSLYLLQEVRDKLYQTGFKVINIDSTIIAQQPKLAPYLAAMGQNIARVMQIQAEQVNVKATTTEGLGFEGREEGISALAVALLD
jgi:2-C-methyl-D-erythritol 2,4-cyclodiphosphate synthase